MNNKLLFIRYRHSGKIDAGGEKGTDSNYKALCQLIGEENISVYYIHESQKGYKKLLKVFSILINFLRGYYYGLSPRKTKKIAELAQGYSYVFIDRSIFGIIAKKLKDTYYKGKIITFFHNVESIYFAAKLGEKPWSSVVVKCVTKNDQYSCDYSDIIIALNSRDKQEIEKLYNRTPDILSPVVFDDTYNLQEYPDAKTNSIPVCLFIGTYFPMNVNGILWFINEVFPQVNIKLQIAGKGMSALLSKIDNNENIEVFSDVPDLRPLIENADFMLFPIFEGSGMKVKTCEALMYGKNIIGTNEAFEGYDLDYDRVGACCNTKKEFIDVFEKFSSGPVKRFNNYSRSVFVECYSLEQRKRKYAQIFS